MKNSQMRHKNENTISFRFCIIYTVISNKSIPLYFGQIIDRFMYIEFQKAFMFSNAKMVYIYQSDIGMIIIIIYNAHNVMRTHT